jgi:hypothetical protein
MFLYVKATRRPQVDQQNVVAYWALPLTRGLHYASIRRTALAIREVAYP